jgi:multiple sugar transport system substrate-binding protein
MRIATRWLLRLLLLRLLPCFVMATTAGTALAQAKLKQIIVASYPSFDGAVKAAIPLYKALRPDVEIKLLSLSYDDHHNALTSALATSVALPDVIGIEVAYLGKFVGSPGLEDLAKAPYLALNYKPQLVGYTFGQSSTKSGVLSAMPADIGPGALYYRQDVLAKAGVTEAQLTASWDGFIEAGKIIKAKTGAFLVPHAETLLDVVIRSNVPSGQGVYFDDQQRVLINTPRFKRAFELARAARAAKLDGKYERWTPEWAESLRRGGVATEMSGAWLGGHLAGWIAPKSEGLWRVAPLPQGAQASWGGSFYAIPSKISAERKVLAWDFIRFMTLDKGMQLLAFKKLDAFPAMLAAADDPFLDEPIPYLGGQRARQLWRESTGRIPALQVNKLDDTVRKIVTAELNKVMEQGKDIDTALVDAQRHAERRIRP